VRFGNPWARRIQKPLEIGAFLCPKLQGETGPADVRTISIMVNLTRYRVDMTLRYGADDAYNAILSEFRLTVGYPYHRLIHALLRPLQPRPRRDPARAYPMTEQSRSPQRTRQPRAWDLGKPRES